MGYIQGTVRDIVTQEPIDSVSITSMWGDTQTSGDGTYYIGVNEGYSALIIFEKIGYASHEVWVVAGPDDYLVLDVWLASVPGGEIQVLGHWMCGDYDSDLNPLDIKDVFTTSEDVHQITKFGPNYGGLVEWKLYLNGSFILSDSGTIQDPPSGEWWPEASAMISFVTLPRGTWSIEVYFEGEFKFTDYFLVGSKDIEETINWQASVPSDSHTFNLFSFYGINTNNTMAGFQPEVGTFVTVTTPATTRIDTTYATNVLNFDCLTLIQDINGSTIYDWRIDNNVI